MKRRTKIILPNCRRHCDHGHNLTTQAEAVSPRQCYCLQYSNLYPPKSKYQSPQFSHIITSFIVHYLTLTLFVTYFSLLTTAQPNTAPSWLSTLQTSNEPRWITSSVAVSTTSTPALIESFSGASSSHANTSSIVNTLGRLFFIAG